LFMAMFTQALARFNAPITPLVILSLLWLLTQFVSLVSRLDVGTRIREKIIAGLRPLRQPPATGELLAFLTLGQHIKQELLSFLYRASALWTTSERSHGFDVIRCTRVATKLTPRAAWLGGIAGRCTIWSRFLLGHNQVGVLLRGSIGSFDQRRPVA
jgi:hypothetical protein